MRVLSLQRMSERERKRLLLLWVGWRQKKYVKGSARARPIRYVFLFLREAKGSISCGRFHHNREKDWENPDEGRALKKIANDTYGRLQT